MVVAKIMDKLSSGLVGGASDNLLEVSGKC